MGEANGQRQHVFHGPTEHSALRHLQHEGVELTVEVDVAGEELDVGGDLADERVERHDAGTQRCDVVAVLGPLGGKPGRRSLEDAPDFDGVPNVLHRELARDKPTRPARLEQSLLREPVEHQTQGCPRDVQSRRERHFAQALARPERPAKNELPHLEERAKGLGFEGGSALVQDRPTL